MKRILLLFLTGFALLTGCTAANEEAGIPDPGTEKASESQAVETGKANRILPKGDILSMTKNIAGESITFPEDESNAITALVEKIESADVIEEADARNPASHLLGFDFLIMLEDADGNAISVCLAPFDDGRVSITIEEKDNDQTIWVKSSSLVDQMKQLAGYEPLGQETIDNITGIVIVDSNGTQYLLSEAKVSQMQTILKHMQETTGDSKCPFDVDIVFHTKENDIEAKYCNDSCGILVVQGGYYRLDEQDAEWLSELIARSLN